jgi:NAD(P)-dependent dehydrogenase (short-subunit alcohol dehydrogenase family)
MRIVLVGATGVIGRAVSDTLATRHELLAVGHSSGDLRVDISDSASIQRLFELVGRFDAVICCAGRVHVGRLAGMTESQMRLGLVDKLSGQIDLARLAISGINDGGSITLSSGLASRNYRPGWAVLTVVNAGLEAFARAAAVDMPRGIRVNVVSPGAVLETVKKWNAPPDLIAQATPAADVARAYVRLVEGKENGTVLDAGVI